MKLHPFIRACRHRTVVRRGTTVTELVVAATLLVSALGTVVPLAVSAGRIQRDARHYQLAVEELSNQLDRLSVLNDEQRAEALANLTPSEETSDVLDEAKLQGEVVRDEDGTRLVLGIQWKRTASAVPIRLVSWLDALPANAEDSADAADAADAADTLSEQTAPADQEADRS